MARSDAYDLLPGATPSSSSVPLTKKASIFVRRKPILSSFLSLALLTTIYVAVFPSHPAALTDKVVPSSWRYPLNDDMDVDFPRAAWKASSERERCDQVWRDEGRVWPPAVPSVSGGGGAGGEGVSHGNGGWGTEAEGREGFSLETEMAKGKTRKEVLKEMVGKTKGYYVRDWPLHLGWNNIRYIIEASLLHAELLNRVLVVPTVVYARACEFDKYTCQAYAKMVNRGDALQSDEWRDSPIEKQWAWLIPTELMMDLALIQRNRPLMTTADYLLLHDLPASLETAKGNWDRTGYHNADTSLHVIPNGDYDNGISRVDRMPVGAHDIDSTARHEGLGKRIREIMTGKATEEWDEVKKQVGRGESDEQLEKNLAKVGAYVLHTWQGSHGMEYVRTVTEPIKQVSIVEGMKGFWDDYHHIDKEVLLLEGETHYWRKPGSLRFTTIPARNEFARMVLRDIMPPPMLNAMAIRLDQKMQDRVGGRMWTAAHMRRGDFVHHEWVMNKDGYAHFDRIKTWMGKGRDILVEIKNSGKPQKYPVPEAEIDDAFRTMSPPKKGDPFYLATDERNATMIEYFKENGAVMFNDLVSPEDRRELAAWSLVFTDVLGVMEQTLLARAGYFYGHALSSVAGGAVNHRGALNKDPRTTMID